MCFGLASILTALNSIEYLQGLLAQTLYGNSRQINLKSIKN